MHKDLRVLGAGPLFVVVAFGCAPPKMAVPAGVAKSSEVLEVTDRSGWSGALADEDFKLGRYAVKDVDRDWDSSSGFSTQLITMSYTPRAFSPSRSLK